MRWMTVMGLVGALGCGSRGSGDVGESGDSESDTGSDCATVLLEAEDFALSLSSEGNTYVQASLSLHLDNTSADATGCPSIDAVRAVFGFDGEDVVVLDIADPHAFTLEPGEQLDTTISADAFEDLPPSLFADHCQPETQGVLEVWSSGTSMPYLRTVPLPIGCACC